MPIQFFNSLGRKKEVFQPIEKNRVKIYSCGPTVYASPHIGNFRAFIFADILRRSLEFLGFAVESVMNITDVGHLVSDSDSGEDKMEKSAAAQKIHPLEIARKYEKEFLDDLAKLNIETPTHLPRASEHITEQVELIKTLEKKGFTYTTSDGIY
ncbi:MAG: class I tRNA ligase family protein, partial [Patescibacteria group bacterium]